MIFKSGDLFQYSRNKDILKYFDIKTKNGEIECVFPVKGFESIYRIWFNYIYKQEEGQTKIRYTKYKNIYLNNWDTIETYLPDGKKYDSVGDNDHFIRIVFAKKNKYTIYFAGLYVLYKRTDNKEILRRISFSFNTDDMRVITPNKNYYILKRNSKYSFRDNINSLIVDNKVYEFDKEYIKKENEMDNELNEEINELKPISKITSTSVHYPRDSKVAKKAIKKYGRVCAINSKHELFDKKDNIKYIEVHHIIPMSAQKYYDEVKLDQVWNIVCLCPNCHREIHYGKNKRIMLKKIYESRKDTFIRKNEKFSFKELMKNY